MNHIELFAGCGGLSLGLETSGFDLLLANELSPMASETFAYNHLNADLEKLENIEKVFWVSSQYDRNNISKRLRENPMEATGLSKHSDIDGFNPTDNELNRGLLVGSIVDINSLLSSNKYKLRDRISSGLGHGGVDLVSGGPPCQSFSLAGMRDHTHHRNTLPGEFANFVGMVKPKLALLENVTGILRPFSVEGEKHYAWFEVAKAFAKENYVPLCLHVNAKYVGTAQNRPRFIMIAFRHDVLKGFKKSTTDETIVNALKQSERFVKLVRTKQEPNITDLDYFDVEKDDVFFRDSLLSPLISHKEISSSKKALANVKDAIDDLRDKKIVESDYVRRINDEYLNYNDHKVNKLLNHELRNNNNKVRARFRLYQVMSKLSKTDTKSISNYMNTAGLEPINSETLSQLGKTWLLDLDGKKVSKPTKAKLLEILEQLYTKKRTQKALIANAPAPAALSIPDDACHYHESVKMQRTLTVREMARIQSFPDWYEIRSKVTTGGKMRKFEVPQYTQIGNAVPPLLGMALGNICKSILEQSK
ncbi:MAG: DNA (cytosine-5)-methyltransferase 1 [Pseudomonadales bacterium]|jgi:DNA (cytosine-5)-methyltransferase 1